MKNKKLWILISLSAATVGLLAFIFYYHIPRIEKWLTVEIEKQSQKHAPVRAWPEKLHLTIFPLGVALTNVRILPKPSLQNQIQPLVVKEISASLSFWGLLRGEIRFGHLGLNGFHLHYSTDFLPNFMDANAVKPLPKKTPRKMAVNLDFLQQLPIDFLSIRHGTINIYNLKDQSEITIDRLNLSLENRFRAIGLRMSTKSVKFVHPSGISEDVGVEADILAQEDMIHITQFKVSKAQSYLQLNGTLKGKLTDLDLSKANLELTSMIDLQRMRQWITTYKPQDSVPKISGKLETDLAVRYIEGKGQIFKFKTKTQDLAFDRFSIGTTELVGKFEHDVVEIDSLFVQNAAGKATVKNLKLLNNSEKKFSGELNVEGVEIKRLLHNVLSIGDIPLHLDVSGKLPCEGQLKPLTVQCKGNAKAQNFHVWGSKGPSDSIAKLKAADLAGTVSINDKEVKYDATMKVGTSQTRTQGTVNYKSGFNIEYQSEIPTFADVENLANLKIEGGASLQGRTQGNSDAATFEMDVVGKNIWFEDFHLDRTNFNLRYKEGVLSFQKLNGSINSSQYEANLSVNLRKSEIFISAHTPALFAQDLLGVFSRKAELNIPMTGTGTARIKAWGPLRFNALSYQVDSAIYRGTLYGEPFDQLTFNVTADKGYVETRKLELRKAGNVINAFAKVDPHGETEAVLTADALPLEEFKAMQNFGLNVAGELDVKMLLKGFILDPQINLKSTLRKTLVADYPESNSVLELEINRREVKGKGQLLGTKLTTAFQLPLQNGIPLNFKIGAKDWDFTRLFSILSQTSGQKSFDTAITANLNLQSNSGDFWSSNGELKVENFFIQRGSIAMRTLAPISMTMTDGKINTKDFQLQGDGTFLKLNSNDSQLKSLNAELSGKMKLALLSLVTPFLNDLRGDLSFSIKIVGPLTQPSFLGSAYATKAFVRLKDFPHPFENATADVLFNQQNILINSLRSEFAGGQLTADGKISVQGVKNIPIDIRGKMTNVSLEVPKGYKTRGSGDVFIKGNWFPYILGARYTVVYGDIEQALSKSSSGDLTVKPSEYLPKVLIEENFQPIHLDLDIFIPKPISFKLTDFNINVDTSLTGRMAVIGVPTSPLLNGQINLVKGGLIKFRANEFEINTGRVEYDRAPPNEPNLYISADGRVPTKNSEQEYDVNMILQGSAKEPKVTLTSSPSLPESDIISLLAIGITSQDVDSTVSNTGQESQISSQIGAKFLQDMVGAADIFNLRNKLGVQVDVSSVVDDTGEEGVAVPKATVRKKFNRKFGASASHSFGKLPKNDVKVEYKMNKNLSVIGNWSQKDTEGTANIDKDKDKNPNEVGVDLEYKVEFR